MFRESCRLRDPAVWVLVLALQVLPLRRSRAEERIDFKTMVYQEDDDRMRIVAPTVLWEHELNPTVTIKLEGIYNSISGASPTGAPATYTPASATAPRPVPAPRPPGGGTGGGGGGDEDDDDESEIDDRKRSRSPQPGSARRYLFHAGATPPPAPSPSPGPGNPPSASAPAPSSAPAAAPATPGVRIPMAEVEDTRVGFNLSLIKRIGRHTPTGQLSFSTESDYRSMGIALTDSVDFNKKNTALLYGGAYTHDLIDAISMPSSETKDTMDLILGVTQLVDPETFFTVNLSLGHAAGYMNDPYKVVELNGELVGEKRPESKDKRIVFVSLNRFFLPAAGAAELSYRWYGDSFGIQANTIQFAWFQKLNGSFVLVPAVRYYDQTEADFYAYRFTGAPEFYSSDYRVSALQSLGYGLKLIWTPNERFSLDLAFDRFVQDGQDGITPGEVYPVANIVTAGVRIWF